MCGVQGWQRAASFLFSSSLSGGGYQRIKPPGSRKVGGASDPGGERPTHRHLTSDWICLGLSPSQEIEPRSHPRSVSPSPPYYYSFVLAVGLGGFPRRTTPQSVSRDSLCFVVHSPEEVTAICHLAGTRFVAAPWSEVPGGGSAERGLKGKSQRVEKRSGGGRDGEERGGQVDFLTTKYNPPSPHLLFRWLEVS